MQRWASNPLQNVRIASPCREEWAAMYGDDRVRFCSKCQLNVYNLSAMTRIDAEHLLASREGRLCARYFRRSDGTILTADCPVGLAALKRKVAGVATAVLSFLFGIGLANGVYSLAGGKTPRFFDYGSRSRAAESPRRMEEIGLVAPAPPPVVTSDEVVGPISVQPPTDRGSAKRPRPKK